MAGVSAMTVSRVINGESSVSEMKRDAVRAAIAKLNYAPNSAARSLAGAGQVRIGLLYSNPSAGFLAEFLLGSLAETTRSDVQIIIEKCEIGVDEIEVARHLVAGGIDGVVLPPPLCESAPMLAYFRENDVPTISVATGAPQDTMLSVRIDDRDAALTMTRHIIALGHRRVGFILGNPNLSSSALRFEGYRTALNEAGIELDDRLVVQGLFTYRSGLDAAEELLDLEDPPTAIFSSNDDMAAAAVAVAHRRGLDVPSDLTVCGFDDTVLATAIWPELTTIHQPIADMAQAAVETLVLSLRRSRGAEAPVSHRLFDFTLIRRQSDAVPRRRPASNRAQPA